MIKNKTASTGIIRDFDLKRTHVRLTYRLILIVSLIIIVVGILPLVWVFLSGFKDIKEFIRDISILPKSFNIMKYVDT
ncbi:MAG TPA: carbohydrate ABC transporter permease, partial [Treponemataceae bacterium]|nr:carbohydrate ABC transporter permease [Treponemataceae bacterium]